MIDMREWSAASISNTRRDCHAGCNCDGDRPHVVLAVITRARCDRWSAGLSALDRRRATTNPVPAATHAPSSYSGLLLERVTAATTRRPTPATGTRLRATLCSFVLGHDPDVATAREIEASVYGA